MSIAWLNSQIVCGQHVVCESLSIHALSGAGLPNICERMLLVMGSIEHNRCEGRLLPVELFDAIDTLDSDLRHDRENRLADWIDVIDQFGAYYKLTGIDPIQIDPEWYRQNIEQR